MFPKIILYFLLIADPANNGDGPLNDNDGPNIGSDGPNDNDGLIGNNGGSNDDDSESTDDNDGQEDADDQDDVAIAAEINQKNFGHPFNPPSQCIQLGPVPEDVRFGCEWILGIDRSGCADYRQVCGRHIPRCRQENEIWYTCPLTCERSCSQPNIPCQTDCNSGGDCQCAPGFIRDSNGECVGFDRCREENNNDCFSSRDCRRNQQCVDGFCSEECDFSEDCSNDNQFCQNGVCISAHFHSPNFRRFRSPK